VAKSAPLLRRSISIFTFAADFGFVGGIVVFAICGRRVHLRGVTTICATRYCGSATLELLLVRRVEIG